MFIIDKLWLSSGNNEEALAWHRLKQFRLVRHLVIAREWSFFRVKEFNFFSAQKEGREVLIFFLMGKVQDGLL